MAGLVSNWCTTLLYGITLVVYSTCVYVLFQRREERLRSTTWILFCTATLQFILSTIYVAFALRLLIEGFIWAVDTPEGTLGYWINPSIRAQVVSKAVYITNSIVGDSVLVWRVYVVWGKNLYACVLPMLLVCGTTVTGYISIKLLSAITLNSLNSLFAIGKWVLATWSLSIATQIISTGLIAGKIWWHARRISGSKAQYLSVIAIVVESGAIYTVATIFLLAFFDIKTQAGAIIGDMTAQIATIVPTLIILRVEFLRSDHSTYKSTTSSNKKISPGASIALSSFPARNEAAQMEVATLSSSRV
ncbi:hypothetical protein BJ912DRAFT_1063133 [Pholiota molesta]|nr:hypothetical protein BJ912DRAFT_1063133 [Pholiota molesta]